jgi:hypothetical protein
MSRALTLRYQESPAYLYSEKSALDVSSQLTEGRPTRGESSTAESDPIWGKHQAAGAFGSVTGPALPVSVTIGGTPAPMTFLGEAPGLVAGVMQINAQVPTGIASGNVPLVVSIGGVASQGNVTAAVK